MELWIRSQDKQSLVKVDNLYISIGNYICYYVEKGKEKPETYYRPAGELARYETNERALEILDDIQNIICGNTNPAILKGVGAISDKAKNIFYQMPEE